MDINIVEIKDRHNIVDVIGLVVDLKKKGKDYFGCCPFHSEKTASFSVNESKQYYHCFGCGANGDVIKFVQDTRGLDFFGALAELGHNAAMHPTRSNKNLIKSVQRKVRLPFDKEPASKEMLSNLFSRCDVFSNPSNDQDAIYTYKGRQAVLMTDLELNPVSAVLVLRCFDNKYLNKEFLHGSCVVLGDLNGDIFLCEDWFTANHVHRTLNVTAVCFFEPSNLYYISQDAARKKLSFVTITSTSEGAIQADKLNLLTCTINDVEQKSSSAVN